MGFLNSLSTYLYFKIPRYKNSTVLSENIHFTNGIESFPFYVDFFHSSITDKTFTKLYMSNMTGIYKTGNAYPSQAPGFTPIFFGGFLVVHLFNFLCFFCFFVFIPCLVCPMLHVSLDCPFLIALWIFPKFIQILKAIDLQTKHISLKNQRDGGLLNLFMLKY